VKLFFVTRKCVDGCFIAALPTAEVKGKAGNLIRNPAQYDFIKEGKAATDTVNPSLWRQSQLINFSRLFEFTDRSYQIRSQNRSNMTIAEGRTRITVFDPMISTESQGRLGPLLSAARQKARRRGQLYPQPRRRVQDAIASRGVEIVGSQPKLDEMLSYLDNFEFWFNIVTR